MQSRRENKSSIIDLAEFMPITEMQKVRLVAMDLLNKTELLMSDAVRREPCRTRLCYRGTGAWLCSNALAMLASRLGTSTNLVVYTRQRRR
jgi:hypothetical protein